MLNLNQGTLLFVGSGGRDTQHATGVNKECEVCSSDDDEEASDNSDEYTMNDISAELHTRHTTPTITTTRPVPTRGAEERKSDPVSIKGKGIKKLSQKWCSSSFYLNSLEAL